MLVTGPALRRGKAKIWMTENKKPQAASADQKMSLCEPRRLGEKAETESCLTCVTEPALCGRRSPCIGLVGGPLPTPVFSGEPPRSPALPAARTGQQQTLFRLHLCPNPLNSTSTSTSSPCWPQPPQGHEGSNRCGLLPGAVAGDGTGSEASSSAGTCSASCQLSSTRTWPRKRSKPKTFKATRKTQTSGRLLRIYTTLTRC